METSVRIAFKEWAVVVEALGRGQQAVILRKGGLIEDRGTFTVDHRRFWLFPTLFHQQIESVTVAPAGGLEAIRAAYQSNGAVQIQFLVEAVDVIECRDLARVKALRGQHIWSDRVVEDRFHYGKKDGIHVIVARVFRLPRPETIPLRPSYGGCRSWVELEQPIGTELLAPVLSEEEFQTKAGRALAVLS